MKYADTWFSRYIRARDMRCVLATDACRGPVECGHLFPRGKIATRWNAEAAFAQCKFHNNLHEENPEPFVNWFCSSYGRAKYEELEKLSWKITKLAPWEIEEIGNEFRRKYQAIMVLY